MDQYKVIKSSSEFELKNKGSKFLGFGFRINSEEEFKTKLSELKAIHKKANHHCYAYRLIDPSIERSSDDGEPSGTAGKPILGQLVKYELFQTCIVVVRYFGGTKLGVRGLIDAYQGCAEGVIASGIIQTMTNYAYIEIIAEYHATAFVDRLIRIKNLKIVDEKFEQKISKKLAVPESKFEEVKAEIEEEIKKYYGFDNITEHPVKIIE